MTWRKTISAHKELARNPFRKRMIEAAIILESFNLTNQVGRQSSQVDVIFRMQRPMVSQTRLDSHGGLELELRSAK